ncbi:heme NO-binding domain-containing protein [uncultured Roseobacter sp.]|uniref:heme NO-binding domain-containing protein n=1 Tax=uncultured Roseobacter sp. TaxID=114847 RepID=UPI00261EA255|nr:heme NO-binding domain-containing protein [uncultured Roseobacter sp.]
MIGIIEKVVVECLLEAGGDELRLDAFLKAGIPNDRVYRIDSHYPDEETQRLIAATLEVTGLSEDALFKLFSARFFEVIAQVFPKFIEMAESSEDLVRMQAKIHALMASGTRTPEGSSETEDKFTVEEQSDHHLIVRYRSHLQLCGLYIKLVEACAHRFGDEVVLEELTCRNRGDDACRIRVKWTAIDGVPTQYASKDPSAVSDRRA